MALERACSEKVEEEEYQMTKVDPIGRLRMQLVKVMEAAVADGQTPYLMELSRMLRSYILQFSST
jgi:hypothetical protein